MLDKIVKILKLRKFKLDEVQMQFLQLQQKKQAIQDEIGELQAQKAKQRRFAKQQPEFASNLSEYIISVDQKIGNKDEQIFELEQQISNLNKHLQKCYKDYKSLEIIAGDLKDKEKQADKRLQQKRMDEIAQILWKRNT